MSCQRCYCFALISMEEKHTFATRIQRMLDDRVAATMEARNRRSCRRIGECNDNNNERFLDTYRLCPISWSRLNCENDKARAEKLIAELRSCSIMD